MSNNIEGKVAVITGASSGLGEASARSDVQGYVKFGPLHRLSCLALDDPELAGDRR